VACILVFKECKSIYLDLTDSILGDTKGTFRLGVLVEVTYA